jgi:hypothetical protein
MSDVRIKSGEQPRYFAFNGVNSTAETRASAPIYKESPYSSFQAIVTGADLATVSATVLIQVTNETDTFNGAKSTIIVNSIAKSDDFIVLGVSSIIGEDGSNLPYFGNPIKHITIGLNKTKKLSPVNSPTAFTAEEAFKAEVLFPLKAVVSIVSKNKKN